MRGSVRQRASGTYQALWREKDPVTGKWKPRGRSFKTEDEAWRFLARVVVNRDEGLPAEPSRMPLAEYLPVWLAGRRRLAANSRRAYEGAIRRYINPHLGTMPLADLTRNHISAWVGELEDAQLSPATIEQAYAVLKSALDAAAQDGLIRISPLGRRAVELPEIPRSPMRILTPDELHALTAAASGARHEALLRFLIASQVRISEALGLDWDDLDLASGTVHIAWQWDDKTWTRPELKSDAGVRTIQIDAGAVAVLRHHRDRLQFLDVEGPAVFPGRRGRLHTSTIRAWLRTLVKKSGVAQGPLPITPHTFRHTGATLMLRAGVPVHVVSRRLGHKDIATTLRHYAHVLPGDDQEAAAILAELLPLDAVS